MILSFDLSLSDSGWATLGRDGAIAFGSITSKLFGIDRIMHIRSQVDAKVATLLPDAVVVEGLAMLSQTGKAMERAGLFYAVVVGMRERQKLLYCVPPTTLKKFITGTGKAQKSEMLLHTFKRFGITCQNDNQGDAVGLAYYGAAAVGQWEPPTADMRTMAANAKAYEYGAK